MDQHPIILSDDLLHLSRILRPCLGPICKQYLLVTRTLNKAVATGSGLSVLRHTLKADASIASSPLVRLAVASVNAHEQVFGDGTTSLVLMIAEGIREARERTSSSTPQMLALSRALSCIRSRWLAPVILPHLASQCIGIEMTPAHESPSAPSQDDGISREGSVLLSNSLRLSEHTERAQGTYTVCPQRNKDAMRATNRMAPVVAAGCVTGCATGRTFLRSAAAEPCRVVEKQGICGAGNSGRRREKDIKTSENTLQVDGYIERMRAVFKTTIGGLFSAPERQLLIDLMVNWIAMMAQQMYDRSNEVRRPLGSHNVGDPTATDASGDTGEGNVKWHTPRRYLVNAARFIVSREGTLLLKAKGATLSESRIVDDGVIIPNALFAASLKRERKSQSKGEGILKFVVLKCPMEPSSSLSPDDSVSIRVTVGVSNAKQHSELLWHRGRVARAVVEALTASGVKLVVCTHAVKASFVDLLRDAGVALIQLVDAQDADYLAQRFGAQAFHRLRGSKNAFSDGADGVAGLARGVRSLRLGQEAQSSSFSYIYGNATRSMRAAAPPLGVGCQVVLRAASNGMLAEYASSISRCLVLTSKWLQWDAPNTCSVSMRMRATAAVSPRVPRCAVIAGGGASETTLGLLFENLAARFKAHEGEGRLDSRGCGRMHGGGRDEGQLFAAADSVGSGTAPAGVDDSELMQAFADVGDPAKWMASAFHILAAAVRAVPRALLQNASVARSSSGSTGSVIRSEAGVAPLFAVRRAEYNLKSCQAAGIMSTGLVAKAMVRNESTGRLMRPAIEDPSCCQRHTPTSVGLFASLSCGLESDVVQPLALKHGALAALLDVLITSLRIGGVVRCRGKLGASLSAKVTVKGDGACSDGNDGNTY